MEVKNFHLFYPVHDRFQCRTCSASGMRYSHEYPRLCRRSSGWIEDMCYRLIPIDVGSLVSRPTVFVGFPFCHSTLCKTEFETGEDKLLKVNGTRGCLNNAARCLPPSTHLRRPHPDSCCYGHYVTDTSTNDQQLATHHIWFLYYLFLKQIRCWYC